MLSLFVIIDFFFHCLEEQIPVRLLSGLMVSEDFIGSGSSGESKMIKAIESPVNEFMHLFNSVLEALHGRRVEWK